MALGQGDQWDETNPQQSTLANTLDSVVKDVRTGVRARMANEHIWPAAQTSTAGGGFHTTVSLQTQTGVPSVPVVNGTTQAGVLFASSGGGLSFTSDGSTVLKVGFPAGLIAMWSGLLSAIPSGWHLCDGTNGTPDLRAKMIPCTAAGIDPGTVSGTAYVAAHTHLQTAHRHSLATNTTAGGRNSLETVNAGAQTFVNTATQVDGGGDASGSAGTATFFALAYIMKL